MKAIKAKKTAALWAVGLMLMLLTGMVAASPAGATSLVMRTVGLKADNPAPTCPSGYWFNSSTGKCDVKPTCAAGTVYNQSTNKCDAAPVTATVFGAKASASDIDTGKVTILADMHIKGVAVNSKNCFWTKPGQKWWNAGYGANGKQFQMETTPAMLCRKGHMLVKVAGGSTGRRCFNEARLVQPMNVVKSRVIWVSSLAQVKMHLHAEAHAVASSPGCPGTFAEGRGSADVIVSLKEYVKSRGSIFASLSASAYGKATANATASVQCAPPTTTTVATTVTQPSTTTVHTTTTVPTTTVTTTTVPTTTVVTTTTPAPQPPSLSNLTQPQEVFANGETYPNINVTSSAMNGHSITVSCGAHLGSMTGAQTFASGGVDKLSFTYTAPNTTDAVGQNDTITCSIHDNTTGLNGQPVSVSFPIMAPPTRP